MSLSKRDGVFYADLRGLGGARVSLKTDDPEIAKRRYREAVAQMDAAPKGGKMTLAEAYRRTRLETGWASAKDQKGIDARYATVAEFIKPETPLAKIDRDTMSQLVGHLRATRKVSDKTINRHLALLSKVLTWAAQGGHLKDMPTVPWLKVAQSGRIRTYTVQEERRILAWFLGQRDVPMQGLTVFLLDTGWRISEALSDFQVEGQRAVLWDQKGGTRSATPLTQRALTAASRRAWAGLSVDQVDKRWRKMREALKLDASANVHALRHTTASRLAAAGLPVAALQKFMRHADIRTTMIYVHLAAGDLEACAEALENCAMEGGVDGTVEESTEEGATSNLLIPLSILAPRPGLEPGTCGLTVRPTPEESSD